MDASEGEEISYKQMSENEEEIKGFLLFSSKKNKEEIRNRRGKK